MQAEPDSALVSKTVSPAAQAVDQAESATDLPAPLPDPPQPRRVILFGARSPIVVDLYVVQGERSIDELALESAKAVLADTDADQDGSTSWEEVAGYTGAMRNANMMSNLPSGRQRELLFRSYDSNANGAVDPDEYIRFYNRGQNGVDWLVLRTTLDVTSDEIAAPLGRWLDIDRNGKLDSREIDSAVERIRLKDSNDDRVLQASEFRNVTANTQFVPNPNNNTPANAIPAFAITDDVEWSELLYRVQQKYTFGAELFSDDTTDWPQSFQELDDDGDGTIWDHELAAIADREPDLQIWFHLPSAEDYRVAFEARRENEGSYKPEALGQVHVMNGAGESLATPSMSVPVETEAGTLMFALSDDYVNNQYIEQLDQSFERLDSDDDDALSEAEFAFLTQVLRLSFSEVDTDEDGRVTKDELEQGFAPTTRMASMRLELWMLPQDDPVFTALDQDLNRQLDEHEVLEAAERLAELDADQDGIVQSTETDFGTYVVLRNAVPGGVAGPPTAARMSVNREKQRSSRVVSRKPTPITMAKLAAVSFLATQRSLTSSIKMATVC